MSEITSQVSSEYWDGYFLFVEQGTSAYLQLTDNAVRDGFMAAWRGMLYIDMPESMPAARKRNLADRIIGAEVAYMKESASWEAVYEEEADMIGMQRAMAQGVW